MLSTEPAVSNRSQEFFIRNWPKMAKLLSALTDSVKEYIDQVDKKDAPDHDTLLLTVMTFSIMCGRRWGLSKEKLDKLWVEADEMYKQIKLTADSKDNDEMQKSAIVGKKSKMN